MNPILIAGPWTTLDRVPAGALVQTEGGDYAVVSQYSETVSTGTHRTRRLCYLLGSGERSRWGDRPDHEVVVRVLEVKPFRSDADEVRYHRKRQERLLAVLPEADADRIRKRIRKGDIRDYDDLEQAIRFAGLDG